MAQECKQSAGVSVATTSSSTTVASRGPRSKPRRCRPNFFVGFRIVNPDILANVAQLQQQIATQFPDVARCLIDIRTLHVTLCTLHLANEQDIQDATRVMEGYSHKSGVPLFEDDIPAFDFHGVDFFGNHYILYSPLDISSPYADTLTEVAETLHRVFDAVHLTSEPFRKPYTPHITLWKTTKYITYLKQINKHRTTPIEVELGNYLRQLKPELFGTEHPTRVELLSMREKEADGWYKVYASTSLVRPHDEEGEHGKHVREPTPTMTSCSNDTHL